MTPEEKAKEIYFAMLNAGKGLTSSFLAQQCALVCVEEIILFMETDDLKHECCSWANSPELSYWHKVKKEISK